MSCRFSFAPTTRVSTILFAIDLETRKPFSFLCLGQHGIERATMNDRIRLRLDQEKSLAWQRITQVLYIADRWIYGAVLMGIAFQVNWSQKCDRTLTSACGIASSLGREVETSQAILHMGAASCSVHKAQVGDNNPGQIFLFPLFIWQQWSSEQQLERRGIEFRLVG